MAIPNLEFSYDGWLVFNELMTVDIFGDQDRPPVDEVLDSFDYYTEGMPKDEQSGFQRLPIAKDLEQLEDLSHQLSDISESLRAFRYIDESWVEQWGYNEEAEEKLYYVPNHDQVGVFWDADKKAMMMRGNAQLIDQKRSDIRGALSEKLKLDSVAFEYDFFLWLLYKEYEGGQLDPGSDLHIRKLTRGGTVEDKTGGEGRVRIEGKDNILKSVVMIAPLLDGQNVEELQGKFILGSNQVEAKMKYGGRVHVLVSDNPMSQWEDARKMAISVRFLSELIHLFRLWENLDPDQKYPPPSFFDDLRDSADSEGWRLRFQPEEVKQQYERKRQGVSSSDDSDGEPAQA